MSEILDNYYTNSRNVGDNSTAGDKVQKLGSKFELKDGLELVSSWEEIHEYWFKLYQTAFEDKW